MDTEHAERLVIRAEQEARALDVFWSHASNVDTRLEFLLACAQITIVRPDGWNHAEARAEERHHHLSAEACFGCQTRDRRLYWHHIIQIHHGGSNIPRNKVALCLRCHATIHPWLPAHRKGEMLHGEWWSLADTIEDAKRRQDATGDALEEITSSLTEQKEP